MWAVVATQYKFRLVGTALALHSSLVRAQLPLPISRAISCRRCHLFAEIETGSCAASTTIGIPFGTSPFTEHSSIRARSGGTAAPSSSVAMARARLCRSPVVHCTRMRAAVAAQYKLRLVGAALAMHSSLARAQSSLPIARAISCHRCHLSAGIEAASCARSTPMASPFTANARPGARCGRANGGYAFTVCHAVPPLARFVASCHVSGVGSKAILLSGRIPTSPYIYSIDWTAGGTFTRVEEQVTPVIIHCRPMPASESALATSFTAMHMRVRPDPGRHFMASIARRRAACCAAFSVTGYPLRSP